MMNETFIEDWLLERYSDFHESCLIIYVNKCASYHINIKCIHLKKI
jgi:hypothetical protein